MSENPVDNSSRSNVFYFQIILKSITRKNANENNPSELIFTISKGQQLFQTTKSITPEWKQDHTAMLNNLRLNFVVLNYNSEKYQEFSFHVCGAEEKEKKNFGEYLIDCNHFIQYFGKNNYRAFSQVMDLGENYSVESQIYVQKHRMELQKIVKEVHHPKGDMKVQLHKIQERSPELREKLRNTAKQNRFRRSPSPTRREIKQIIARRSPRKEKIRQRKDLSPEKKVQQNQQKNQEIIPKEQNKKQETPAPQPETSAPQPENSAFQQEAIVHQKQTQVPQQQPIEKKQITEQKIEQTPQANEEIHEKVEVQAETPQQVKPQKVEQAQKEKQPKQQQINQQKKQQVNTEQKVTSNNSLPINPKIIVIGLIFLAVLIFSFWPSSSSSPQKSQQKPEKAKKPSKVKQKKEKKPKKTQL